MENIQTAPKPSAFFNAMSQYSYAMGTALSDILDNSISAGAKNISIMPLWNDGMPTIEILDDGCGMSRDTLITRAMRFDCSPEIARSAGDLGKFGMGMKTASFSQGRVITVITKDTDGIISTARWDLDWIEETNDWNLQVGLEVEPTEAVRKLQSQKTGTIVKISNISKYGSGIESSDAAEFNDEVADARQYISRAFHRFIENGIMISVGPKMLAPYDPCFLSSGVASLKQKREIRIGKGAVFQGVLIDPSVDVDTEEQGIYFYRGDRLVMSEGWHGMTPKSAHGIDTRLARLIIEINPADDLLWNINVQKDRFAFPADRHTKERIRDYVLVLQNESRNILSRKYGRSQNTNSPEIGEIWIATGKPMQPYLVNRSHPDIARLTSGRNGKQGQKLLNILEENLPASFGNTVETCNSEYDIEELNDPLDGIPEEKRSNIKQLVVALGAWFTPDEICQRVHERNELKITPKQVEILMGAK